MIPEDEERLAELEDLVDADEDLDEDTRAELRELRGMAREEKARAKALAKFDKARVVFRVVDPDEGDFYTLDLATAQKCIVGAQPIEQVERAALSGKIATAVFEGPYGPESALRQW